MGKSSETLLSVLCNIQGSLSWMDNRLGAGWLRSLLNVASWKSSWDTVCELFQLPGMSALSIAPDFMKKQLFGVAAVYLHGSVFWLLCHMVLPHQPLQNLFEIANFIKTFQARNHTDHKYRPKLTKLTMFEKKILPSPQRKSR